MSAPTTAGSGGAAGPSGVVFDYQSPDVQGEKFWDAVAELQAHGDVTWVESNGGFWAITSHEMVVKAAQDWQTFSSAEGVAIGRPGPDVVPYMAPIELDPPRQRSYRRQVDPELTIKAMARYAEPVRRVADELIDTFVERGSCDLSKDFARKFPGTVFFRLVIGCDDEEFRSVEPLARTITFEDPGTPEWTEAQTRMREWAVDVVKSRGGDDERRSGVVRAVSGLNHDGVPFSDHELGSGLQLLVQGGIGTSSSAIGVAVRVLSEDQELQARVGADRSLIPRLVEECLRLETPLPMMFRTVHRDVELGGRYLRRGDKVALVYGGANRDPSVFDSPERVDLDRPHNRHVAFGAGVHRCIGSNLARLQVRVALEQLIERLSPFHIPAGAEVEYSSLQARGPSSLPLQFNPGPIKGEGTK